MAARGDLNDFIQHRRKPERIDRATGEPLAAIGTAYDERCRCRGERVGQLDAVATQYEEVILVQGRKRRADHLSLGTCKMLSDSRDTHRTPRVGEQPEDGPKHGSFPGRSAGSGSRFDIVVPKLLGGLDHEVRQDPASFPSRDEGTVCSNSRLKGRFEGGTGMDGTSRIAIGGLSKHTGANIETIRYYERVGLLPAPTRTPGGYRLYGSDHLKQLIFIRRARR